VGNRLTNSLKAAEWLGVKFLWKGAILAWTYLVFGLLPLKADAQVEFVDPNLEAAVRQTLGKPVGTITPSDMATITLLEVGWANITNLTGLEWATNVKTIYLPGNSLTDVTPLQGLSSLSALSLEWNELVSVPPLTNAALTFLDLLGNPVTNIDNLAGLSNLASINFEACSIHDAAPLRFCPRLQVLSLYKNKITDISVLSTLTNLGSLDLGANLNLGTLAGAPELPALTNVSVDVCSLTNLAGIENWPSLQTVDISQNSLTNCSALAACTNLQSLSAWGNPLGTTAALGNLPVLKTLTVDRASLSNLCCLGALPGLQSVSAANNKLQTLTGLESPTNLANLILDGNPILGTTGVGLFVGLTNLSFKNCALSNLDDFQPLVNLQTLYLDNNKFLTIGSVTALTNLSSLSLVNNSQADFTALGQMPWLRSLFLGRCGISNISFFTTLPQLRSVDLSRNRLSDISPLNTLVQPKNVSLTVNLLDLAPGSSALMVITNLTKRGASVSYLPQNQPPQFYNLRTNVGVPMNGTRFFTFNVSDDMASPDKITVLASATNTSLISTAYVQFAYQTNLGVPPTGLPGVPVWTLVINPVINQIGTTTLSLIATDDTGLSTNAGVSVVVAAPVPVDGTSLGPTNWVWQTDGHAPWSLTTSTSNQTYDAAQSASLAPYDDSWLEASVTGPGVLSFSWKMTSTNGNITTRFPELDFSTSMGGSLNKVSLYYPGTNWHNEKVSVPPGNCVLHWDYISGPSNSCLVGKISYIATPINTWLEITNFAYATNGWLLTLHTEPGGVYEVQSSADLVNWYFDQQVATSDFQASLVDTNASNLLFYRLLKVPND
jgi:internalin A